MSCSLVNVKKYGRLNFSTEISHLLFEKLFMPVHFVSSNLKLLHTRKTDIIGSGRENPSGLDMQF